MASQAYQSARNSPSSRIHFHHTPGDKRLLRKQVRADVIKPDRGAVFARSKNRRAAHHDMEKALT